MESKPHILCVDDDDKIRELLKVFLRKNNFYVSTAHSVDKANKLLNLFIFDIIVLKQNISFGRCAITVNFSTPLPFFF